MLIHRLPPQLTNVMRAIKLLTYDRDRDAAPVDEVEDLFGALYMDRRDFERAVKTLAGMKLLREFRGGGRWWYEPMPLPDEWPDRPASKKNGYSTLQPSFEEMTSARARWERLEAGLHHEPAQAEIPLQLSAGQRFADGGAAEQAAAQSRDGAADRERRRRESQQQQQQQPGDATEQDTRREEFRRRIAESLRGADGRSESGGNSPNLIELLSGLGEIPPKLGAETWGNSPELQTPARTRAPEHVHVPTSVPQSMYHGHGREATLEAEALRALSTRELEARLDAEAHYQLEQLYALPGVDRSSYHYTWLLRLNDRWRSVAIRALSTAVADYKGGKKANKGWGEYANYNFRVFKEGRRRPANETKLSDRLGRDGVRSGEAHERRACSTPAHGSANCKRRSDASGAGGEREETL